ncbi:MAG: bile acid:sodium symporter family protein [Alphaproteobacteria bacterium]|nr:bile acid:sodium symporter family protein [Alphaproteobacteria bacterium]
MTTLFIPLGLAFLMVTVGLGLAPRDFRALATRPAVVAAGLVGQLVLVPTAAFLVAVAFALPPVAAVGLVLVAAVPGGVTSNFVTVLARGDAALSVVLTAGSTLAGLATVPLVLALALAVFDPAGLALPAALPMAETARAVLVVTVLPMLAGMAVRALRPAAVARRLGAVRRLATLVFAAVVVAAFAGDWAVVEAHWRTVGPAVLAFNALAVTAGLALARTLALPPATTLTFAVECGLQNVALALFLAAGVLGEPALMVPAVLYVLAMNAAALVLVAVGRRTPAPRAMAR